MTFIFIISGITFLFLIHYAIHHPKSSPNVSHETKQPKNNQPTQQELLDLLNYQLSQNQITIQEYNQELVKMANFTR